MQAIQSFTVCLSLPNNDVKYIWTYSDEDDAQDAADFINTALQERGTPTSVSCAFVV